MPDHYFPTLWKLAESWPCDFALLKAEKRDGKATPLAIDVHMDQCRKCNLQRHLLRLDELLKRTAGANFQEFSDSFDSEISEEAFSALQEHAQHVREEFLGCPRTA